MYLRLNKCKFNEFLCKRCASSAMEDDILKGIRRSEEAIDNSLGSKSTGHFQAMPSVLNRFPFLQYTCTKKNIKAKHAF